MNNIFFELSFPFVMDLYRVKTRAESKNDLKALENLLERYPELFTSEFAEFIERVKEATQCLDAEHGTNFSAIVETAEHGKDERILN